MELIMQKKITKKQYIMFLFTLAFLLMLIFVMLLLGEEVSSYFYIGFIALLISLIIFIIVNLQKVMDYEKDQKIEKITNNIFLYESNKQFSINTFNENLQLKYELETINDVKVYRKGKTIILISGIELIDEHKKIIDTYYEGYIKTSKSGYYLYSVFTAGDVTQIENVKELTIEYTKKSIITQKGEFSLNETHSDPISPVYTSYLYNQESKRLMGFYIKKVLGKFMNFLV